MLMVAALAGSAPAYRLLLEACAQRLRKYFGRRVGDGSSDVEDLVQETLVAIHRRRASYDPALPFTAWLHAIARYKLIDNLRRRGLARQVPLDDAVDIAASDDFAACLAAIDVERLLAELPEKHRTAIQLTRIDGHSVDEAAAMSGQSQSGIKIGIYRGIRRLAARVNSGNGDD